MEVRARRPPRRSGQRNDLPLSHFLPERNESHRRVTVKTRVAAAVVDHDEAAVDRVISHVRDGPSASGPDI